MLEGPLITRQDQRSAQSIENYSEYKTQNCHVLYILWCLPLPLFTQHLPVIACVFLNFCISIRRISVDQNCPSKPSLQNDVKWLTKIMSRCGVGGRVLGDGGGGGGWWWVLGTNRGAGVWGPPCCRRRPSTPHLTLAPQVSIPLFAPSIFEIWPRLCQLVLTSAALRTLFCNR